MRRLLFGIVLVSCGRPEPRVSETTTAAPADAFVGFDRDPWATASSTAAATGSAAHPPDVNIAPDTLAVPAATEVVVEPTSKGVVAAIHAGPITAVAITDDGRVAVSADSGRSVRLWPTLDGKHEPVVLAMRSPSALAIAHDGSQLVIAGLDDAGQLELLRTTGDGESIRRVSIETARPFVAIWAIPTGFLGMRDDRVIALFDFSGAPHGEVAADPEQHLGTVAVRGDHAIALIEHAGTVHGRWLHFDLGLHWGDQTPALPIAATRAALSPSGARIAGLARGGKRLVIAELKTGRMIGRVVKNKFADPMLRPLGFAAEDELAFTTANATLSWWDDGEVGENTSFAANVFAIGDGKAVADLGASLAVTKPSTYTSYLGYRIGAFSEVRAVGNGYLATDSVAVVELDASFRTRKVHEMPVIDTIRYGLRGIWIVDDKHVLASGYDGNDSVIYLVDLTRGRATLVTAHGSPIAYEESSGLLAYRSSAGISFVHYDRKTGAFGKPAVQPTDLRLAISVTLLDPKIAGGSVAAIVTSQSTDAAEVSIVRRIDPEAPMQVELAGPRTVELSPEWWQDNGDMATLVDRKLLRAKRRASRDGTLTAEVHDMRITLRDASGVERWTVPSAGTTQLVWTPRGDLVAFGPGGIAQLDLQTGDFAVRHCGARFGKWDTTPEGFSTAAVCEHF